ncbi:MAG: L-serine ammonia-lyase, iron-sulfur-dependent, subunit alpha [Bacteroides sp.]|nr:L-serine ammonia-lyase, iron-sulfur-dependent, subunit alpha [Roseburia sp.]MCM1345724.1 L-serine ammonia-lyase, iron-sulfur-dependent, subunit alpha [Bacteroides sp.]MCM1419825.1 L-serine ammonia-lyase, iron-sulfur-dependent, subunit alpha [Bacteroides sp.]
MEKTEREKIISLIKSEVVPAIGCTEPIAVALCVAKATQTLGCIPEKIDLLLSANILKNAMGVGIPGTGMTGLPIAIALGALAGKPEYNLEVLKDITPEDVERGKDYLAKNSISINLKKHIAEKLYIEVSVKSGSSTAKAIISGGHSHFILVEKDGDKLLDEHVNVESAEESECDDSWLNLHKVYEFATTVPLEEIEFIREARELNEKAAQEALKGCYGHELGKTLSRPLGKGIMGDSIFSHIISATASACDARMAGAMIPVMSNSGSGNQGICATLPVVVFAEENHNTDEELMRALIFSHLTAIYIKQSLGKLSALCGCVVASTGSSCGITYLMGGTFEQITAAVKNMIANLTGMICDGAKPSCALKLASGVSTCILSAMLAMQKKCVTSVEGIIDNDVDKSIHNLTKIGKYAMTETDHCVLDIMTSKE